MIGTRRTQWSILTPLSVLVTVFALAGPLPSFGQRGGRGGNSGDDEDTELIIVFRDAGVAGEEDADRVRSDGEGAYIHGDEDIDEAIIDSSGFVWLGLLGDRKGVPEGARRFYVNLDGARDPDGDERSGDEPAPDFGPPYLVGTKYLFVNALDASGNRLPGGIQDITDQTGHQWARFSVWFREPINTRTEWRLSYGSGTLDGPTGSIPPDLPGEGLPLVHCVSMLGSDCIAWIVEKESKQVTDSAGLCEANRTALSNVNGEYIMPGAIGICLKEYFDEASCRNALTSTLIAPVARDVWNGAYIGQFCGN